MRINFLFSVQAYEKKTTPKWRYDLGQKKNFEQVGTVKQFYPLDFLNVLVSLVIKMMHSKVIAKIWSLIYIFKKHGTI